VLRALVLGCLEYGRLQEYLKDSPQVSKAYHFKSC
jgi:hypothetical protein